MLSWNVVLVRYACPRRYRPVGTTLAENLLEALDKAQEEFAHVAEDDETITVHCEPTVATRFERALSP